jgi:hypothetical protein
MRFEVLRLVTVRNIVCFIVTPCNLIEIYQFTEKPVASIITVKADAVGISTTSIFILNQPV